MGCDPKIINRLKRSEGQLRGIVNMLEQKKDCQEVLTQLLAVHASIDKLIGIVVTENLKEYLASTGIDLTNKQLTKALELISKTR